MAIDELLDEHEQSRRVQEWLRRNGAGLVGGVLLGLAAIGGWKWWQQRQAQEAMGEADRYQTVIQAIEARGVQAASQVQSMPAGLYRSLAALHLAKAQADAGKSADAIATLKASLPEEAALRAIFDRRIARLQIDAGRGADALKTLTATDAPSMELRGDALVALGRTDEARETYRKALAGLDEGSPQRRIVELKYTQVGGTPVRPQTQ
jgi:predicted negative regulator of RcsB-dependent stress response